MGRDFSKKRLCTLCEEIYYTSFPALSMNHSNMGPFVFHHNYAISCDGAKVPSRGSDLKKKNLFSTKNTLQS